MDSIHPEARRSINERALALLEKFRRYKPPPTGKPKFPSERIPTAALSDDDLIDVPILTVADQYGRTVAKFYHHGSVVVGLREADYPDLPKIVGALQKVATLRSRLSEAFLEDHVFLWGRARLRDGYTGKARDDDVEHEIEDACQQDETPRSSFPNRCFRPSPIEQR